jgi:hypothetical protein
MTLPQTTGAENTTPADLTGTDPNSSPEARGNDPRSDLEQIVASRSDAVARGDGGTEPAPMTDPGEYSGVSGDGGEVKNQGLTQQ